MQGDAREHYVSYDGNITLSIGVPLIGYERANLDYSWSVLFVAPLCVSLGIR